MFCFIVLVSFNGLFVISETEEYFIFEYFPFCMYSVISETEEYFIFEYFPFCMYSNSLNFLKV